jgi:phosphatidylserine decarboxylase
LNRFPLPNIHSSGWPFIAVFVAVAVVVALFSPFWGLMASIAAAWCVSFFRDPKRVPPQAPHLILSPADGMITAIAESPPPPELEMGDRPRPRVSIFLSIFDVHVNRVPADGVIVRTAYRPGKFFNASFDKASELNERMAIRMTTATGHDLAFVQIAGLIARRIQCDLMPQQRVRAGERFGIIRFGSRMDVYVPPGCRLLVRQGQRAIGGETVIAEAIMGPNA